MYEYRCTVLRVVDADTLHVDVDLGLDVHTQLTVRLAGIDAVELRSPTGQHARLFVESWVTLAGQLTLTTVKDRREKYGRYLGYLTGAAYAEQLHTTLIAAGFAKPYDGGAR